MQDDTTRPREEPEATVREITAVVTNFNGGERLIQTLRSLRAQRGVRLEILVFDDGSTDGSPEMARASGLCDAVMVSPINTRNANKWRDAGLQQASHDLVLVTDNDVDFEPGCVRTLAATFDEDASIAAVTPVVHEERDGELMEYSFGSRLHFLALTTRLPAEGPRIRDSVGTGITAYRRSRMADVGSYDDAFFIGWGDDGELHLRLRLAGRRSVVNTDAAILHHHKPFGQARAYRITGHTHNRLRYIFTHYSAGTLIFLFPLLAAVEVAQAGYFALAGLFAPYVAGLRLFAASWPEMLERRRFIQSIRRVPDRDLLSAGQIFLPDHFARRFPAAQSLARAASTALGAYWHLCSALMALTDRITRRRAGAN